MRNISTSLFILASHFIAAQVVTTVPAFPVADQPVTISVDVTGTSLANFAWDNSTNPVYLWAWIEKGAVDIDAPTNINPATTAAAAAKCSRVSTNKYEITITATTFFAKPASEIQQIGLKLKSKDWAENKQTDVDKFITFSQGFDASFTEPTQATFFKNTGEQINIIVDASQSATLTLKINGATVSSASGTTLSYNHTANETAGTTIVTCEAVAGSQAKTISFSYTIRTATVSQARPAGIIDGINYSSDQTKATLSLWAPSKNSVYVIGDFTNWGIDANYQMKKDGEHFWLEISGLTAGTEYAFQYLVDESLRIADPYADKILDPDDSFIPSETYPSLKPFPEKALSDKWYFNRASVLQTGQTSYAWQKLDFQKPPKNKLVIYELLIRDFFDTGKKNYQNLIDTIKYLKRLGVNAIELMPVTEFNGNDSWGYNPTFMFAPDKFYGTKNKLKEFIDHCHINGIAVIMDMVMNQQDLPNAYVMMDFDFTSFKPTANNKWFNTDAKHPFNVFFDMNHESSYTKKYLDTVNHYWLKEYKIDGFRYDLSKGFTQTNNPNNVGAWGNYDASRIAILKRMYDKILSHTPDAYIILEHFAANDEEKELAEYGMMLWFNHNNAYAQSAMGYADNSDFSGIYYKNRGWKVPHGVGYMESHDEERMMLKNIQFGNSSPNYTVKNLETALKRIKAAATFFYTVPGPKMLWQFGELGYDISIDQGGRVSAKPIKWNYYSEPSRKSLYDYTAELIKLKSTYPIFNTTDVTMIGGGSLQKQIILKSVPFNNAPSNPNDMNAHVVGNFDVIEKAVDVNFSHTGMWYDFVTGDEFNITASPKSLTLAPGQFYLFTDVKLKVVTGTENTSTEIWLYPNPVRDRLCIKRDLGMVERLDFISMQGAITRVEKTEGNAWDVSQLPSGLYVVEIVIDGVVIRKRVIKW
jgi:1,4-alpha-glucan branching enzyme